MYLRIETLKLTFPGNPQNSISAAQRSLPDEKTTDFQSVLPTLIFNSLSPSTGACFSPTLAYGPVVSPYQDMRVSHLFFTGGAIRGALSAKQQLTGKEVFSSTLKAAASQSCNKATNQTAL